MTKLYFILSVVLLVIGISLALVSYWVIESIPLTALGISISILGLTSIASAYARPSTSIDVIGVFSIHILLIYLAVAFGIADILLMALNQEDLAIYFIVNSIIYLIVVSFYIALNPKSRNALTAVGAIIFTVFLVLIAFKIIDILK